MIKKVPVSDEFNFQGNVKDQITSAALAALTPAKGDRYIITDGANQYKIALCTVGGVTPTWEYIAVSEGFLVFDESDDKYYKFITTWTELSPAETATTIAAIINGSSADTPLDADEWSFRDNVDSILKKITWANIKATLKTYFEGIVLSLYNGTTATTQAQADNSTKLATTAYVDTGLETKPTVVDWTNYFATSTIVGWSAISGYLYYKKVGKIVFVSFYFNGNSNATTISFTLPYTSQNTSEFGGMLWYTRDSGTWLTTPARVFLPGNSLTAVCYKDNYTGAWTATGSKTVTGQFYYEASV